MRTVSAQHTTELLAQWHAHYVKYEAMLINLQYRRCLGLAAMVDNFDRNAVAIGEKVFLPNHAVTWMGVRDLPSGAFPGDRRPHRRGAIYVTRDKAALRYGMPCVDLASARRDAWDFRNTPVRQRQLDSRPDVLDPVSNPREFAILNKLNDAMTCFALTGAQKSIDRRALKRSARWMPRPYLAFRKIPCLHQNAITYKILIHGQRAVFLAHPSSIVPLKISEAYDLWWNVSECGPWMACDEEAFILPPIPIAHWDLRFMCLPGQIRLNATANSVKNVNSRLAARDLPFAA